MPQLRPLIAEALGTFYLCFAGIAAILSTGEPINSGAGLVGVALAHGLALAIAVSVFGGISGAHINPAVTCGFLVTGRIPPLQALGYTIAQLLGATAAAGFCRGVFPESTVADARLGIPLPADWVTVPVLLAVEFVLTFLLMISVYGTAVDERGRGVVNIGGFAIGLTVTFDILAAGKVTGASMNPARSFGPAVILGEFSFHWCYWVAPIAGAAAAALIYEHLLLEKPTRIEKA